LFSLPKNLIAMRGPILTSICFAFYYSQNKRKINILKIMKKQMGIVGSRCGLDKICNSSLTWLEKLGLTIEEIDIFTKGFIKLYSCLWNPTTSTSVPTPTPSEKDKTIVAITISTEVEK